MSALLSDSASRNSSLATNWSPRLIDSFSAAHVAAQLHLLLALHLGKLLDRGLGAVQQPGDVHAGALQQRLRSPLLVQHGREHVTGLDVGVVAPQGQGLGLAQGFLKFRREFVHAHSSPPVLLAARDHSPEFKARAH